MAIAGLCRKPGRPLVARSFFSPRGRAVFRSCLATSPELHRHVYSFDCSSYGIRSSSPSPAPCPGGRRTVVPSLTRGLLTTQHPGISMIEPANSQTLSCPESTHAAPDPGLAAVIPAYAGTPPEESR